MNNSASHLVMCWNSTQRYTLNIRFRSNPIWRMPPKLDIRYWKCQNSAADCSISLKFGTKCDQVTADVLQMFKAKWLKVKDSRSQRENVAW